MPAETTALISVIAALLGVILGAWITPWVARKNETISRKNAFLIEQLKYFYSPMLSLGEEVSALSLNRSKILASAADHYTAELATAKAAPSWPENFDEIAKRIRKPYLDIIKFNNDQLKDVIIPNYGKILTRFNDYYYLSEASTREYYKKFSDFLDYWNRGYKYSLPIDIAIDLAQQDPINPFLVEINTCFDSLRSIIQSGKAC